MTQSWHERLWRTNNAADIARGLVPNTKPFSVYGERITAGAVAESVLWETGMPNALTVPQGAQLSFVAAGATTQRLKMIYLDGDLIERIETIALTGTTPVLTQATDIRFINLIYALDGPLTSTFTATADGITYATVPAGSVQFDGAIYRVPAGKRLMLNALYAGAVSGTSASRVVLKIETTFFNGDRFADAGTLHPVGAIALQDNAVTLPFGPFPIPAGEIVAMTLKCDKAADVVGGFFGWLENET